MDIGDGEANDRCQRHRHDRLKAQHESLSRKLKGHYAYYGIVGNRPALFRFLEKVVRVWVKWLGRRSQRPLTWWKAVKILQSHPLLDP
jgi:RNA-directed DNA polymerase